ncbi:MAG TPA: tetratricopeptide repeat protein, partial [Methanocorpusculum sp.]|nr:tetratricopeptide repeat protein [Methanocorpusculum sp.]
MVDIGGLFGKNDRQNPWTPRGELSFEKGLYEDAVKNFSRAVEHEPQNSSLWYRLGVSQNRSGQHEQAARSLAKATELDPQNTDAWITLATLLADARRFDEAVSAISHVTLGDREPFLQELKCEWLERIGRYADAAAVCSHLTNLRPDDKHLRMRLAELTLRSGNFAEAKGMFDQLAATAFDDRGMFLSSAAFCCEMLNDRDGALVRYAGLSENDPTGWYRRARLEESMGKYKDAAASYGMVQQYSADTDITVTVRRALCLYWDGNEKESASQLVKVLSRGYANAELWYLLGIVSFLSGNMKRASEAFLEMIHLNQSNTSVWYMKGCAEYLSGRYKEAIDSFTRMGRLGGDSGRAPSKMKWFAEEDGDMQLFNNPAPVGS